MIALPVCPTCGSAANYNAELPEGSLLALCQQCGTIRSFIRDESTGVFVIAHTDELSTRERGMLDAVRQRLAECASLAEKLNLVRSAVYGRKPNGEPDA